MLCYVVCTQQILAYLYRTRVLGIIKKVLNHPTYQIDATKKNFKTDQIDFCTAY